MIKGAEAFEELEQSGVLAVISLPDDTAVTRLGETLLGAGIRHLEITLRNENSLSVIGAFRRQFPEIICGAGTVLEETTADLALEAGARFLVSPGYSDEMVAYADAHNVPYIPCCITGAEISRAVLKGLTVLKYFPAVLSGGVPALKLLHGPFPTVKFIPTGGITLDNLSDFRSLSCVLACGGSYMAPSGLIADGKWEEIAEKCRIAAERGRR